MNNFYCVYSPFVHRFFHTTAKILACIFGLWIGVGLYTWFNIEAILKYGQTVLWVYLIIALCFVCVVGGMIAVGHVDYRAATLVQELERMKRAKDEATDNDFADPVAAGDSGCIIN